MESRLFTQEGRKGGEKNTLYSLHLLIVLFFFFSRYLFSSLSSHLFISSFTNQGRHVICKRQSKFRGPVSRGLRYGLPWSHCANRKVFPPYLLGFLVRFVSMRTSIQEPMASADIYYPYTAACRRDESQMKKREEMETKTELNDDLKMEKNRGVFFFSLFFFRFLRFMNIGRRGILARKREKQRSWKQAAAHGNWSSIGWLKRPLSSSFPGAVSFRMSLTLRAPRGFGFHFRTSG
jgi:hypothetical protein